MRILSVSLQNYKSFAEASFDSFSNVNMVFGYNNSGKSNLFKFIQLLFSPKINVERITYEGGKVEEMSGPERFWEGTIKDQPYIFKNNSMDKPITFVVAISFDKADVERTTDTLWPLLQAAYGMGGSATLYLEGSIKALSFFDSEISLKQAKLDGHSIYSNNQQGAKYFESAPGGSPLLGNQSTLRSLMSVFNNCVVLLEGDRHLTFDSNDSDGQLLTPRNFKRRIFDLSLDVQKHAQFLEFVSTLKEFSATGDAEFLDNEKSSPFSGFELTFGKIKDAVELFVRNPFVRLPISSFGTGVQQIIYILTKIFDANRPIVLIEELELNLSPKYQEQLIQHILTKAIEQRKVVHQLFYSTHSALLCYRNDFQCIETVLDKNGNSTLRKASKERREAFASAKSLVEGH